MDIGPSKRKVIILNFKKTNFYRLTLYLENARSIFTCLLLISKLKFVLYITVDRLVIVVEVEWIYMCNYTIKYTHFYWYSKVRRIVVITFIRPVPRILLISTTIIEFFLQLLISFSYSFCPVYVEFLKFNF